MRRSKNGSSKCGSQVSKFPKKTKKHGLTEMAGKKKKIQQKNSDRRKN